MLLRIGWVDGPKALKIKLARAGCVRVKMEQMLRTNITLLPRLVMILFVPHAEAQAVASERGARARS